MIRRISDSVFECPSFVDTHSHDDLALLTDPERNDKRLQGVGPQVIGNCGISPFPPLPKDAFAIHSLFDAVMGQTPGPFSSAAGYCRALNRPDVRVLQGYNALRAAMFGPSPRALGLDERARIGDAVAQAVEDGAAGLSLGLAYLPAVGADIEELTDVARRAPIVTVHLRNESIAILESVEEALTIARRARCRLHISHLKIAGKKYWPLAEHLIPKMLDAHDELGVTFDHYPYAYGCTALSAILPPEIAALPPDERAKVRPEVIERRLKETDWENYVHMCGWEGLRFASLVRYPQYNLASFAEADPSPLSLVLKLIQEEPHPAMLVYSQSDEIINEILKLPFGCVGTDGLPPVRSHPRLTSSFPEYLKRARVAGLTPEQAIEKASILPRRIFRIPQDTGGIIRFDWEKAEVSGPPGPQDFAGYPTTSH